MSTKRASTTKKQSAAARKATPAKKATARGAPSDPENKKLKRLQRPKEERRKLALRRLGLKPADLAQCADITSMLKQGKGGLKVVLAAMRYSKDLNVVRFLEAYDAVPERDRASLPWEAIALSADVDATYLLGGAILALRDHSSSIVKILALTHHPEVVKQTLQFAALPGGDKDRNTIHSALGLLPTAKGSTFIINPGRGASGPGGPEPDEDGDAEPVEVNEDREGDLNKLFPSLTETQETLAPPSARMLESGDK